MAEARGRRRPRPPPRLTMVELDRDFPVLEIPVVTSAGARSSGLAAGTMDQGAGAAMTTQPLSDGRIQRLGLYSTTTCFQRRRCGFGATSASTTSSRRLPKPQRRRWQPDGGGLGSEPNGPNRGSDVFLNFEKNDF
jgi:hypothetical protein